jgi:serine-type D-Ala-D-Ala carboxypeptidase (penicillin-binding protein 5/6)
MKRFTKFNSLPSTFHSKLLRSFILLAGVILAVTSICAPSFAHASTLQKASQNPAPSDITAPNAYMLDLGTNKSPFMINADSVVTMASTTKLVTYLVIEQRHIDFNMQITVPDSVTSIDPSAVLLPCNPGEIYTVDELVKSILIESDVDSAYVLATGVAGSEATFVGYMNDYVTNVLGLKHTHFVNSHGLDVTQDNNTDNNHTTAKELAQILQKALQYSRFLNIASTPIYQMPAVTGHHDGRVLYNTDEFINNVVWSRPGFDFTQDGSLLGVKAAKTGSTEKAGRCIALYAEKNGKRVILVLMGYPFDNATDAEYELRYTQASELLHWYLGVPNATPTPTPTQVPATNTPTPTQTPPTNTPEPTQIPATNTPEPTQIPATSTPTPTPLPTAA